MILSQRALQSWLLDDAQSMCDNNSARTVCTLQSAYSRTLKHYTSLTPDPPPFINIVFVVLNFVWPERVLYQSTRNFIIFWIFRLPKIKKLGKFIGNNLAAATPPLHLCAAGFSASKRVDYFKKLQLDKSDERPADQKKMKLSGIGSAKDHGWRETLWGILNNKLAFIIYIYIYKCCMYIYGFEKPGGAAGHPWP